MAPATLRMALPSDALDVGRLEALIFGADAWSAAAVAEELDPSVRLAVVACEDGEVVGYAVAAQTGDLLDLHRVAVGPSWRRSGIARALLSMVRGLGRDAGAHRMLLEVSEANVGALAFYGAEGFAEIDRRSRYYRDGTSALVLEADLEPVGVVADPEEAP